MKIDDTASDISYIDTTCMQLKMFSNVKVPPTELVDERKNEDTENKDFYENQFPNEKFDKLFMKLLENVPISMDAMLFSTTLVASIFSLKVTLVNLSNYSVRDVTGRKVLNRFSPVNIGYNDETLLTSSLNYVNEDRK